MDFSCDYTNDETDLRPQHHIKEPICSDRPKYRQGRNQTAVKVYTINDESVYLLIQGVPALGVKDQFLQVCRKFGGVVASRTMDEYPNKEEFTDVYLLKYNDIRASRKAKRKMDDLSFFGGVLHVCYAPEFESLEETRFKLQERRKSIAARCHSLAQEGLGSDNSSKASTNQEGVAGFKSQESVVRYDNVLIQRRNDTQKQIVSDSSLPATHNPTSHTTIGPVYPSMSSDYLGGVNPTRRVHHEPFTTAQQFPATAVQQTLGQNQLSSRFKYKQTSAAQAAMWSSGTFTSSSLNTHTLDTKFNQFSEHTEKVVPEAHKPHTHIETTRSVVVQPQLAANAGPLVIRPDVPKRMSSTCKLIPRQTNKLLMKSSNDTLTANAALLKQMQGPKLPPDHESEIRGKRIATDATTLAIRSKMSKMLELQEGQS